MATKTAEIKIKRSGTALAVPTSLAAGEPALNTTDKKLYSSDGTTVFQVAPSMTEHAAKLDATHAGTGGTAHAAATTSVAGFMSSADKTKLGGVATGATANATDAQLRDRTTHTGAQAISTVTGLQAALDAKVATASVGVASGIAPLGADAKVPSAYLPSYVDVVVEVADYASLPATGETGKIYVTLDTNKTWRWSGTAYAEITASPGSTDVVTEGSTNLYFTVSRVLTSLLTGLSTATNAVISAGDTVLSALGKLQAQISSRAPIASPTFTGAATIPKILVSGAAGSEGGNIELAKAPNGTATSGITFDVYNDTVRFFAYIGGSAKGYQFNLALPGGIVAVVDRANHTGTQAISTVSGLQTTLDAKAPLASPALTGTPTAPTATTGTATTQIATTAFVAAAIEGAARSYYADMHGVAPGNTAAANTTALNSLIATVVAAGGGVIVLPSGAIQLNALATISGASNLLLQGQGAVDGGFNGGTILAWQNATGDCITFSGCQHSGIKGCYHRHDVRRTADFTVAFRAACFHPVFDGRVDYGWSPVGVIGCSEAEINLLARYTYGPSNLFFGGDATNQTYGASATIAADNPYPITGDATRKTWSSGLAVSANDIVYSPTAGMIYQVTAAGSLGATEPNTIGGSTGPDGFTTAITSGTASLKFVARQLNHVVVGSYAYSIRLRAESHVLNGYRGLIVEDTAATGSSAPKWIYAEQFEADHSFWNCVEAYRGESLYLIGAWLGSSLTGRGLVVDSGFTGDVSCDPACRISGNWLEGVYVGSGTKNVRLIGSVISDNSQAGTGTYHGVMLNGTTDFVVSGLRSTGAKQGYGVWLNTGCDYFTVAANNLRGNATGGLYNAVGTSTGRREVSGTIS